MKKKILYIEDEADQIAMVKTRLETNGYEFISALDGESGLDKVQKEKPDLVLLDILLPKMQGDQVCSKIREDPKTRDTPILIITAIGMDGLKEKCMVFGADNWIAKPYDSADLLKRIKQIIG